MSKVTTNINYPIQKSSQLREIAEMVSEFYDLDVVLDPSDVNDSSSELVDLKIMAPSGKVVGLFHMDFFPLWDHWTFGGQTFIIKEHMDELRIKARELRKKK